MNTCFASMRGLIVTACYSPSYLHFNSSVETNEYDSISSTPSSLSQTQNTLLTTGIQKPPLRIENRNNGKREQRSLESCLWVLRDYLAQEELTEFVNGVTELRESGISLSNLLGYLDIKAVRLCLAQKIQNGRLKVTLEALKNLKQLGFNVHDLLDQNARLLLAKQYRKLLQQGFVKDCVDVIQILSGTVAFSCQCRLYFHDLKQKPAGFRRKLQRIYPIRIPEHILVFPNNFQTKL